MSLIEILLLLAFVFFPLIQAVLERMGKPRGGPELPPPEHEAEEPPPPVVVAQRPLPEAAPDESWSSEWGTWPAESAEDLAAEEVVTEEQADELIAYQERLTAREIPEAARVTVPVVSMEALEVDRASEHRRFHQRITQAARVATPQRPSPAGGGLRNPAELRRAIILAELLGPPQSLR
jgi:hypothetical protein